jgi:hypothetical protein
VRISDRDTSGEIAMEVQATASAMLTVFDGDEQPFEKQILISVHNNFGQQSPSKYAPGPNISIHVPFHDGPGDMYAVLASADGYRQTGCFFKGNPKVLAEPKLILIRDKAKIKFVPWSEFKAAHPGAASFMAAGADEQVAQSHYEDLALRNPDALACLLNLTQAMSEIDLNGRTPISYFKAICWDQTMLQDRFFGYVDPAIIPAVRAAAAKGFFSEEKDCAKFHPGSTHSWKQIAFDVANVQLTFHENDTQNIDGLTCVRIEPDIDLYKEIIAHGLAEVVPNLLSGGKTDPVSVFLMRWTTAEDDSGPSFDPGYDLA